MKRLLIVLLLAAPCARAQKSPVYECWVLETPVQTGSAYVTLGIARDSIMVFKNRFPLATMDAVQAQCRIQIADLQGRDSKPIQVGKVDLTGTVVDPPPPPDPALTAFQADVNKLERLRRVLAADDSDLLALQALVTATLKAHPEYLDSI